MDDIITGTLDQWSLGFVGPCAFIVGTITGDVHGRFGDDTLMTTSMLVTPVDEVGEDTVVETLNSRYLLRGRATVITTDAFLFAASLGGVIRLADGTDVTSVAIATRH